MDADTIGASIESNTTSAFDRKKPFVSVTAEGSYNDLTEKLSPKGSVDFATRLGEDFGVAGGISYYRRKFATDNIEAEGWKEEDGVPFFEKLEYRSEEHTSELQSLMRISYAVFCLKKQKTNQTKNQS